MNRRTKCVLFFPLLFLSRLAAADIPLQITDTSWQKDLLSTDGNRLIWRDWDPSYVQPVLKMWDGSAVTTIPNSANPDLISFDSAGAGYVANVGGRWAQIYFDGVESHVVGNNSVETAGFGYADGRVAWINTYGDQQVYIASPNQGSVKITDTEWKKDQIHTAGGNVVWRDWDPSSPQPVLKMWNGTAVVAIPNSLNPDQVAIDSSGVGFMANVGGQSAKVYYDGTTSHIVGFGAVESRGLAYAEGQLGWVDTYGDNQVHVVGPSGPILKLTDTPWRKDNVLISQGRMLWREWDPAHAQPVLKYWDGTRVILVPNSLNAENIFFDSVGAGFMANVNDQWAKVFFDGNTSQIVDLGAVETSGFVYGNGHLSWVDTFGDMQVYTVVPEPNALPLLVLGGVFFAIWRKSSNESGFKP